jgi:hypothetical protein
MKPPAPAILQSGLSTNQSAAFAGNALDGNGGSGVLYVDVFSKARVVANVNRSM